MIADRKVYLGSYTATLLDTLSGRGTRVELGARTCSIIIFVCNVLIL